MVIELLKPVISDDTNSNGDPLMLCQKGFYTVMNMSFFRHNDFVWMLTDFGMENISCELFVYRDLSKIIELKEYIAFFIKERPAVISKHSLAIEIPKVHNGLLNV